jgi:hypothetical protein
MTMTGSPIAQQEEKFRVLKRPLAEILKKMLRLEKSAKRKNAMLEVTLINGFLVLNAPGMNTKIEAHTSGSARFSISLSYFAEILKDQLDETMEFHLSPHWLHLRSSSFPVQTTFFEDDRILRSIQLPVNYTQADLARLIFSGKYTEEEIAFNAMKDEGMEALRVALEDFERVAKILQPYGLDKTFVMDMIQKSLVE